MTSLLRLLGGLLCLACCAKGEVFRAPNGDLEKDSDYWLTFGRKEIENAVNKPVFKNRAKNVILFLGDGLGISVNTAGRIYKSQKAGNSGEEGQLTWEKFPNVALLKTYNLDKQVADSAATATAYLGGVKANYFTIGVNGRVQVNDCAGSLREENAVSSIMDWAQEAGKDTGIVTTTRITHATPAVGYAHTSNRTWECDAKVPPEHKTCKDIARQLVEDEPGKNINVVFGGGRRQLGANLPVDTDTSCLRADGRNLVQEWRKDKESRGMSHRYVTNKGEFAGIDVVNDDFVLGLFAGSHLPYELDRDATEEGVPSLAELTETAIRRLRRNTQGFVLLVEGGRIDHALHDTKPKYSFEDLVAMDEAVAKALHLVDLEDTLVIVTADHSHVMTINGYPERGNDILGTSTYEYVLDNLPHPTLMFTNGHAFNFTWNGTHINRIDLTSVDTTHKDFVSPSLVQTKTGYETHGGEDVAAWAAGPMAHLFHKVHEQTHVAHVIGYAGCIGPYREGCPLEPDSHEPTLHYLKSVECDSATCNVSSSLVCLVSFVWILRAMWA